MDKSNWINNPIFQGEFIFIVLVLSAFFAFVLVKSERNSVTMWIPLGLGLAGFYVIASGLVLTTTWPSAYLFESSSPLAKILSIWPYVQIIYGVVLVYLGFLAFSWLLLVLVIFLIPSGSIVRFFQSDETLAAIDLRADQREKFNACKEDPVYKAMISKLKKAHMSEIELDSDKLEVALAELNNTYDEQIKGLAYSDKELRNNYREAWISDMEAIYDRWSVDDKSEVFYEKLFDIMAEHESNCLDKTGYSYQWKK
jgi:hypothetical protein